jgi:hypothetical protein
VITIKARGWQQFLTAFGVLRAAGVEPVAGGGNEMRVPDGTDVAVLRAVAATGAAVHADLTEPVTVEETPEPSDIGTEPDEPAAAPGTPPADDATTTATADDPPPTKRPARKATRSRTRKPAEE